MNWQDVLVKELSPKETGRGFESRVGQTGLKIVQLFNDTPDMLLFTEANRNASGPETRTQKRTVIPWCAGEP